MTSIYNEWFGIKEFASEHFPEGIKALEEKVKVNNWRKGFLTKDAKYFSRLKFLVNEVIKESKTSPLEVVLRHYDSIMKEKDSVAALEGYIKNAESEINS